MLLAAPGSPAVSTPIFSTPGPLFFFFRTFFRLPSSFCGDLCHPRPTFVFRAIFSSPAAPSAPQSLRQPTQDSDVCVGTQDQLLPTLFITARSFGLEGSALRGRYCNVPLLRAYSVGHFRSEPRTKTAHASDQTCLGPNPHASDQHASEQCASEQWPEIPAVRFGPKGISLSHCASAHYSLLSLSSLSYPCPIVVVYYCLSITIYSPL